MGEATRHFDLVICPGALGDTVLRILAVEILLRMGELEAPIRLVGTFPYLRIASIFLREARIEDFDAGPWWALWSEGELGSALRQRLAGVRRAILWIEEASRVKTRLESLGVPLLRCSAGTDAPVGHKLERLTGRPSDELQDILEAFAGKGPSHCGQGSSHVVIHPGAGSPRKRMPYQIFAGIVGCFVAKGYRVIWLIGPAEMREPQLAFAPAGAELVVEPEVERLASLLRGARLFVGNDSGVAHLAAALGVPVLSFFRATDPLQWHPVGPNVYVLDCRGETTSTLRAYRYLRPQPDAHFPPDVVEAARLAQKGC